MYVCICNGYRESQIRALARSGVRSVQDIYRALGSEPNCGGCLDIAQIIVDETGEPPSPNLQLAEDAA